MPRNQHPSEFQEHAVSKARTRGKRTLESVAAELNMPLRTLKGWLKRSGLEGAALPHAATLFNQSKLSSAPPPGQFSVGVNTDDAVIYICLKYQTEERISNWQGSLWDLRERPSHPR